MTTLIFDGLAIEVPAPVIPVVESEAPVIAGVEVLPIPGPAGVGADEMMLHVMDPTPHPAYDDAPSFSLIFENHLL